MKKQWTKYVSSVVLAVVPLFVLACGVLAGRETGKDRPDGSGDIPTQTVLPFTATTSETATPTAVPTQTLSPTPSLTPTVTYTPTPLSFSFIVNADSGYHSGPGEFDDSRYFRGACEQAAVVEDGVFMVTLGDLTPFADTLWTVENYFLDSGMLWYPVIGNHDIYAMDVEPLRTFDYDSNGAEPPNIIREGPPDCEETTFSFDYRNAHFVILNVYCDTNDDIRTDGAIVDALYDWLVVDLAETDKPLKFVFGHEPAFPQPDVDIGLVRHEGDSLDQYPITRDRFWSLLQEEQVVAYITGHTHSHSVVEIDGVWQVDVGHAMGISTQAAATTYVVIRVEGNNVTYETYRGTKLAEGYTLRYSGTLRE